MPFKFNVDEIFEMAEEIERNGAAFYRAAAETVSDEGQRKLLTDLAEMEDSHEKVFVAMRGALSAADGADAVFDPAGEAARYLQSFADGHVFDRTAVPSAFLEGGKTLAEILKKAIDLEKDSIVFYAGMKEMVPAKFGADKIDGIVREEMSHITLLTKQLSAL